MAKNDNFSEGVLYIASGNEKMFFKVGKGMTLRYNPGKGFVDIIDINKYIGDGKVEIDVSRKKLLGKKVTETEIIDVAKIYKQYGLKANFKKVYEVSLVEKSLLEEY